MNQNLWPPPTNGLTIEQLVELNKAAIGLTTHLKEILPTRCKESGGHQWDNIAGFPKHENCTGYGPTDSERWGARGLPYTYTRDFFRRTCVRCGHFEDAPEQEIITRTNPFTKQPI